MTGNLIEVLPLATSQSGTYDSSEMHIFGELGYDLGGTCDENGVITYDVYDAANAVVSPDKVDAI